MPVNFSKIQNHIISKLKNAKFLKYVQMKPLKTPNDLYNYHLQFLVKKGFVNKTDEGYSLSQKGIKYVADPLVEANVLNSLFKINVITLVSRVNKGKIEILQQIRKSNPSYGKIGVPGGVVLKGESILDSAKRKLKQETGLDADFKLIGCERRIMYEEGMLFSDLMFPITYSNKYSGVLNANSEFGDNMWVPIDKAILNESNEYDSIKTLVKILKMIKNKSISKSKFLFEESVQIKDN